MTKRFAVPVRAAACLTLVVALCVVGGCAHKAATSPPPAADNSTTSPDALFAPAHWRLTELSGRAVQAGADGGQAPTLAFAREGNSVSGFGGCNRFNGTFEFSAGNSIRFSKFAATQMACPDMAVETEFLKALETADNFYVDGKALVLNKARMAPLARFEAVATKAD